MGLFSRPPAHPAPFLFSRPPAHPAPFLFSLSCASPPPSPAAPCKRTGVTDADAGDVLARERGFADDGVGDADRDEREAGEDAVHAVVADRVVAEAQERAHDVADHAHGAHDGGGAATLGDVDDVADEAVEGDADAGGDDLDEAVHDGEHDQGRGRGGADRDGDEQEDAPDEPRVAASVRRVRAVGEVAEQDRADQVEHAADHEDDEHGVALVVRPDRARHLARDRDDEQHEPEQLVPRPNRVERDELQQAQRTPLRRRNVVRRRRRERIPVAVHPTDAANPVPIPVPVRVPGSPALQLIRRLALRLVRVHTGAARAESRGDVNTTAIHDRQQLHRVVVVLHRRD